MRAVIAGVGSGFPSRVVQNDHFDALGLTDGWIRSRTGIQERRWLAPSDKLSDIGLAAALQAMHDADCAPDEIDFVLAATITHDRLSPSLATELAFRLGSSDSGAVDVNGACAGFLYALDYAVARIESGRSRCVLVCGADATSRILNPGDPTVAPLFGDGAGAVIVRASGQDCSHAGGAPALLGSDGSRAEVLGVRQADGRLAMKGIEVYQFAIAAMADAVRALSAESGIRLDEIDLFVPHQANARIVHQVGLELGLPPDRVVLYIEQTGNTSAATIPTALAQAQRDGRLFDGAKVMLTAFGAGLTWGAMLVDWRECPHCASSTWRHR
ncbi:beta-ketoacyl-ACP synthase 3 [Micromonospora profundi]|uniref:3-oxoacyl-ACP synthase III family protein n=1 Tax=Micromonospora profundi TaxID=1420889 RepID=UPI0033B48926